MSHQPTLPAWLPPATTVSARGVMWRLVRQLELLSLPHGEVGSSARNTKPSEEVAVVQARNSWVQ